MTRYFPRNQTSINEDPYGQYNAPTLVLKLHDGKHLAEVIPFGAAVLGAMGRIDIVGEYGKREKIVYLSAKNNWGQSPIKCSATL